MIFDYDNKTIQVKVVYYGPAMSGETTTVKQLFSYFDKGDSVESIDSSVGRTLFFDFGVLEFKGTVWGVKFLVYSATGQNFYASTRPATLNGVDGIIFVVDSQRESLEHNIRSWNELKILFREEFYDIPVVISLNKDDLQSLDKLEARDIMSYVYYEKFKNFSLNKTIATEGVGVLEAFQKLIRFIFPQLNITFAAVKH
ncbi:hypothetical protein LCGC14_1063770 [marine sediment metagenome]|uniref:GTPase domain-containing protein n=1 Tax=marine sediment metagenome TaxID=412755 RepID=A0A0F9N777_9ZZZZ